MRPGLDEAPDLVDLDLVRGRLHVRQAPGGRTDAPGCQSASSPCTPRPACWPTSAHAASPKRELDPIDPSPAADARRKTPPGTFEHPMSVGAERRVGPLCGGQLALSGPLSEKSTRDHCSSRRWPSSRSVIPIPPAEAPWGPAVSLQRRAPSNVRLRLAPRTVGVTAAAYARRLPARVRDPALATIHPDRQLRNASHRLQRVFVRSRHFATYVVAVRCPHA